MRFLDYKDDLLLKWDSKIAELEAAKKAEEERLELLAKRKKTAIIIGSILVEFQDISYSRMLFLKKLIERGSSKLFANISAISSLE